MSAPGPAHSVDVLRKGLIVAALVVGVVVLHMFAVPGDVDHRGLMALGFVVLAAYTIGELAEVLKLPHITGYLLAGLLLGPSAAHELAHVLPGALPAPFDEGVLNEGVIGQLSLLDTLALPLIALTAGGELHIHELRKGLKPILGVLAGQTVTLLLAFMGFALVIGGIIPGIGLPEMSSLDMGGQLAVGGVLGALGLATSAAATIAIILGVGAKGTMTRTVLSVVVLKDVAVVVLFAATTAAATAALGTGGEGGLSTAFLHIGLSGVLGVAVGGVVHLYLRFIGVERLLFLVALIYTTAFLCDVLHAEVALVFIAAGFVVANFSDQGEVLIHDVERLSLPVFVVFFTLAGARLHVDVIVQMAGYAALLVAVRAAATWAGVRIGGQLTGADENTKKYGWMGMIAQAGLAISLAGQLPGLFPGGLGEELFALVLAGVAVHEVIGPAMLQSALGKAGETPSSEPADPTTPAPVAEDGTAPVLPADDPWGLAYTGPSMVVTETIQELEADLRGLADTIATEQADPWAAEGAAHVVGLRRSFLRAHRKAMVLARDPDVPAERMVRLVKELEQAWRGAIWARAGADVLDGLDPVSTIARIDQRLDGLPASAPLPIDPTTLAPRDEAAGRRLLRALARTSHQLSESPRDIAVRDLWRFHVGGVAVGRLEGLYAPLVRTELDLARSLGVLFADLACTWPRTGGPEATETLDALRTRVLDSLTTLGEQFDTARDDVQTRAHAILGGGMADAKRELPLLGSLDLPHWVRRFSRVYDDRNTAVLALTDGLRQLREVVSARHRAAGVEMEVAALQVTAGAAIRSRARAVERLVEDLGVRPLRDVDDSVGGFLDGVRAWDDASRPTDQTGEALARRLRERTAPVMATIAESRRLLTRLSDALHTSCAESVEQTVHQQVSRLTEGVSVPARGVDVGDWDLPTPVPVVDLALREGVRAWLDARVGAALESAADDAHGVIAGALSAVEELERVVGFNMELAANELDVFTSTPPTPETRALVSEMLQGAIGRCHLRTRTAAAGLSELRVGLPETIAATVPSIVGELSSDLVRGDLSALRRLSADEARFRRELRKTAGTLQMPGNEWPGSARHLFRRVLGQARWEALSARWTPPATVPGRPLDAIPVHPDLPVVYRRLFSEQVVATVQLSTDKSARIRAGARVLSESRTGRAVAVVAEDPAMRALLVDELLRDIPLPPEHIGPDGLDRVAHRGAAPVVVEDLGQWLRLVPGGRAPAHALAAAVLGSVRPWVWVASPETWHRVSQHTDLGSVVGCVVAPGPLDVDELERALLGRHAMSGMEVDFRVDDLTGVRLRRVLQSAPARARSDRHAWFVHLHQRSGGRLSDALRLWMAAVASVDEGEGRIELGPVPPGLPPTLHDVHDTDLLVLRRALAASGDTPEDLARVTMATEVSTRGRLQRLAGRGLLTESDGAFTVPAHLESPVRDQVRARGWKVDR